MLPREHRITRKRDFSAVMKRGARAGTSTVVVSVLPVEAGPVRWRCGFIVSKAVGNAVMRHRTTRRLRHIIAELMAQRDDFPGNGGIDVVVRALPAAAAAEHSVLVTDLSSGLRRAVKKAAGREKHRGQPSHKHRAMGEHDG
ncbi:ribonuclease P protein component [Nesterenkonia alba]|uniref:ribonuclease P protein component n=1 Tax=Nesterenkonia alba TaxID=515814 RepID=UPI0003B68C62|nr:ribonuclease P protein component [Nesterenkonia alba]